jgi:DNA mismatch repair ATPase MutS
MHYLENSYDTLNITELLALIKVITPYGKALKKDMSPYSPGQEAVLEASYSTLELFVDALAKDPKCFHLTREIMKGIKPLYDTLSRLKQKSVLSDIDFFELKQLGFSILELNQALAQTPIKLPDHLHLKRLIRLEELLDPERNALTSFYLYDAYSEPLKVYREAHRYAESELRAYRKRQREHLEASLQVRFRPNGELTVLKQDKVQMQRLENEPVLTYSAENYMSVTFRIKEDEQTDEALIQIEAIKKSIEEEEKCVREELTQALSIELEAIETSLTILAALDLWIAKALLAHGIQGVRPQIAQESNIYLEEGRHIKVEALLRKEGRRYTPISIELRPGVTLITGANMGGKTVSLKLVGLLVAMLHYGLYIPAKSFSGPLLDFLYLSVGDMQNMDQGLSTFGSEIFELARVLPNAEGKGLILIDELARGTNPEEGSALSTAILKHLNKQKAFTVVTTHFDGVKAQENIRHYQVKGLNHQVLSASLKHKTELSRIMDILNQQMDYQLIQVSPHVDIPRDALFIAQLMGIDPHIIEEAHDMIKDSKVLTH